MGLSLDTGRGGGKTTLGIWLSSPDPRAPVSVTAQPPPRGPQPCLQVALVPLLLPDQMPREPDLGRPYAGRKRGLRIQIIP